MAITVEVAVVGDPDEPIRQGVLDQSFFDLPYGERRRVRLQAEETDSLANVMERAAEAMGIRSGPWPGRPIDARSNRVAFYMPEDEAGIAPRGMARVFAYELILVDRDGRAIFGVHDHRTVSMADLIRAGEAGTLEGDPLRPYLMLDFGWGDAPPPDWTAVQQGLDVAWQVLEALGVVGGAVAAAAKTKNWLAERIYRARNTLASHSEWMQKGYRPDQFEALLATRKWTAPELAPLLGCPEGEAEAVLWAMGFAYDAEAKRWVKGGDDAATVLADIRSALAWVETNGKGWDAPFRAWLLRYLETGERPPFEGLRPSFDDDHAFVYRPTLGERVDSVIARFRRHR
jgi:hypothetical protein